MMELSIEATSVAHGIHYGVVGVGLAGLLVLLGPQLLGGRRAATAGDEHALRVMVLADQVSSGGLGVTVTPPAPATWRRGEVLDPVSRTRSLYLPRAGVSSAAAAGIHAALGPAHFRDTAAFGLFFAGAALAQIGWSVAMAMKPSRRLLVAAVLGNSAVLLLWLVTRAIGLPGLMSEPEAVGVWDMTCGAWELAVVVSSACALRARSDIELRLPAWTEWQPAARVWALGCACVLPVLTLTGVGI